MRAHESPCERAWRTRATTTSSSTAPRLVAAARAAIAEPSSGVARCCKRSTSSSALVRSIRRRTSRSTSAPEASSDSVTMSIYLYTTPDVKKHLRCWPVIARKPKGRHAQRRPCWRRFGCPDHHRSEEHTSELQSLRHLVCRLLLEK